MVSLENMKTNRPKKKQDDNQDRPFLVLAAYRGAVVVDLPNYIQVNKSFHKSKVRLWYPKTIASQAWLNKEERRNIAGRVAMRDDDGNITEEWEFERIIDVHDEDMDKHGLTYLIKWKYYNKETWELEDCLKGYERALIQFYEKHPKKLGPPTWLEISPTVALRRRGRPCKAR